MACYLCRHCGGDIIGKGPSARVCVTCENERRRKTSKNREARNPRTAYYRKYYLDHKEEHNRRSAAYMRNMDRETRNKNNRDYRAKNALAIKIKRALGLKTLTEARAMLAE